MHRAAALNFAVPVLLAAALSGCENAAAPYMIDGAAYAISLVREQRWFWSSEVEQALVLSKMPKCQRRFAIRPGTTASVKVEVYARRATTCGQSTTGSIGISPAPRSAASRNGPTRRRRHRAAKWAFS